MYDSDPITTELTDIAVSICAFVVINSLAVQPLILKNNKYDGALSKNADANEHNKKYAVGIFLPLLLILSKKL